MKNRGKPVTADILRATLAYDPITGVFTRKLDAGRHKAGAVCGSVNSRGYLQIMINQISYPAHRLAWLYMTGGWPPEHIDHINGAITDNRWANLRSATRVQNMQNRRVNRNGMSGLKGAHYDKSIRKYRSRISVGDKRIHIGVFDTAIEAHEAYIAAANRYFGEFARAA